jgi:hypothetical protein
MKVAIKIIAYCVWFGFIVWLSVYCDGFSSNLINLIEKKFIPTDIPPEIDFAITIVPWNCFISLLICLPVWLMKKQRANAVSEIGKAMVFFILLLGCNLFGILIWIVYFPESIGDYTGVPSISTIEPYAINDGWSPFKLWCTWWAYLIASNVIAAVLTFSIWLPKKSKADQIIPM